MRRLECIPMTTRQRRMGYDDDAYASERQEVYTATEKATYENLRFRQT